MGRLCAASKLYLSAMCEVIFGALIAFYAVGASVWLFFSGRPGNASDMAHVVFEFSPALSIAIASILTSAFILGTALSMYLLCRRSGVSLASGEDLDIADPDDDDLIS